MRVVEAGSYESNDIRIFMSEGKKGVTLELESTVYELFGKKIEKVILETLKEEGVEKAHIKAIDKGALDFTIKSRVKSLVAQFKEGEF